MNLMGLFNKEDMDSKIMDEIESEMNERFEELDNLKNLVQTDLALESIRKKQTETHLDELFDYFRKGGGEHFIFTLKPTAKNGNGRHQKHGRR